MALFLFVLFALGYVFGLLLKNPTAGKFLIFGFAGIFIYEPVKDAGLLASTVFLAGIISHHVTPSAILDVLPRLSLPRRARRPRVNRPKGSRGQRKSDETTEQTHRRYEEYVKQNRGEKAGAETEQKDRGSKREKPQKGAEATDRASADLRQERERLKREQDRLEAERQQFDREQREHKAPPDTRTDEQILGVCGDYTLAELKQARNAEVKRWNTSNMRHKPVHLIEQAEEEAKQINLAYERLVKQFR